MTKNRKKQRYPQNEPSHRGQSRQHNQFLRDGSSGHLPSAWNGSFGASQNMQYPLPISHMTTLRRDMTMMAANVPHMQWRNDNRGLRHRLFNEDYRYAGPQQVYAPSDVNGPCAEPPADAHALINEWCYTVRHSSGSSRLRGDAPEFVPAGRAKSDIEKPDEEMSKERSEEESAMSSDRFESPDSSIKVEDLAPSPDETPMERVPWLVVSSTR